MNKYQEALDKIGYDTYAGWDYNSRDVYKEEFKLLQELVDAYEEKYIPRCEQIGFGIKKYTCGLCTYGIDGSDLYCKTCGKSIDWPNSPKGETNEKDVN